MKKLKLLLPLLLLILNASAQKIIKTEHVTDHSIHVMGDSFEGIIFEGEYKAPYPVFDTTEYKNNKWFTPSNDDIVLCEKILYKKLKNMNAKSKYFSGKVVSKALDKSYRQYIGYITPNGDRFVYVNGFPTDEEWAKKAIKNGKKTPPIPSWYNNLFEVLDGGASFWHIEINLNTKKIISLFTNGVA